MTSAAKAIPKGYHTVTPYLTVQGVEKLIGFLKTVFGATEIERLQRADGTIGHAELRIGDSIVMLGEPTGQVSAKPGALYIYVDDTDGTYERAIRSGATSIQPPQDMYYGDRNAGILDASGNTWWIATHLEDITPDELQRRAAATAKPAGSNSN